MRLHRLLLFLLVSILGITSAQAQTRTIKGKVLSEKDSSAVANAAITYGTKGISADEQGNFTLTLPSDVSSLQVTALNYLAQTVPVTNNMVIYIKPIDQNLDAVVVIGYGTAKKKDLTGSIATISSKDFNTGAITTPDQLIQGKVAGVVITPTSGQPGVGSTIRIRGGSSLNASNDPLIIVDGVPLSNTTINGSPNPLSMINPNDIESFSILKDASAAAIYGNRASNGVIIITTKKGKSGALKVNFSSVNSLSQAAKKVNILSASQLRSIVDANATADQQAWLGTSNTNWQNAIYRTAFSSDNNISVSGGIKGLPYRLTVGYLGQDGILKTGYLKRTSAALNLSPTFFNNTLKVDVNIKGTYASNRFANSGAVGDAIRMDPTQAIRDTSAAYSQFGGYWEWLQSGLPNGLSTRNPVAELNAKSDKSDVKRSIGNIQLDYRFPFIEGLRANLNAGYDISRSNGNVYVEPYSAIGYNNGGSNNDYTQYNRNKVFDFYFNYVKELTKIKSRIDATIGYEYQDFYRAAPAVTTYSVLGKSLSTGLATIPTTTLPDSTQNTLLSYYGRVTYGFMDRYLLTATVRRDGTSRFNPNVRWGNFPSLAFAWRINQEDFLKNSQTISDLKLRLGYGITGQQDIGDYYPYIANYTTSTDNARYPFGSTYYTTYRGKSYDANIKWEQTATYNIGIDYGFLKNRISGSIDLYSRKTSNLIVTIPAAAGSNLSNSVTTNVGDLTSKGAEFSINAIPIRTNTFTWNLGFNAAYNTYKITNLGPAGTTIPVGGISGGTGTNVQIDDVGYTRNVFYLYKQVYDNKGNPLEGVYANVNGTSGTLNYYGKSPDPKVTLGFNSAFNYKEWMLSFSMHGSIGNYMYNNVASNNGYYASIVNSSSQYIANASTSYLKSGFKTQQMLSDYYLENASFLRMDVISLSYNVGRVFTPNSNLRLSAIVQNPFVITKYTGLDPEIYGGIDNNIYPKVRVYSLGINLDL